MDLLASRLLQEQWHRLPLLGTLVGGIVGGVGGSFVGKTAGGAAARAAYNIRR